LETIGAIMAELEADTLQEMPVKEKAALAAKLFQAQADKSGISLN
jgi:hypothetical protein